MELPTDYSILSDLIKQLDYDLETAENILSQPNASAENKLFYTRQRDWCQKFMIGFIDIHKKLKNLSMRQRARRCVQNERDLHAYEEAAREIMKYRKIMFIKLKKEEEELIKAEQILLKKQGEKDFVRKNAGGKDVSSTDE